MEDVVIRTKKPSGLLKAGQIVLFEDGTAWSVDSVSPGGAHLIGVHRNLGRKMVASSSSAGYSVITLAALGELNHADVQAKRCMTCEEILSGALVGFCPEHAKPGIPARKPRSEKITATPEEVARIIELRGEGMAYSKIEEALGWPDSHGCRSWKIVKELKIPGLK